MERRHTIFTMNQKKNEKKSKTKTNSHNKMDIKLMTRAEKRVYTGAVENFQRLKLHCHSYNSLVPRLSAAVIATAKNRKMTQLGRGIQSQTWIECNDSEQTREALFLLLLLAWKRNPNRRDETLTTLWLQYNPG